MARVFKRAGSWWIDFKDAQGVRRRKKVGPSKRVAQEVLDGLLGNVARRQHLGIIDDSAIGFGDFRKIWWERVSPTLKPRSQERWSGIVELHLKRAFPGSQRAITKADADGYIAKRIKAGVANSTINREMTVLKHILTRAVQWEYLSISALAGMKLLKEPSGRTRFLNMDEIQRLLVACLYDDARSELAQGYMRPFVVVALNSGMRRNEILSLTRKSVDWVNRVATLADTKNGSARYVPLNQAAFDALRSLPARIDTDRLFPFNPNAISIAFLRTAKRAGVENCHLHDLRHTFASYQAMAGIAGRGLQALLGHKDARMTMRYSHLSDSYLRAAVDAVVLDGNSREDGTYLAPTHTVKSI